MLVYFSLQKIENDNNAIKWVTTFYTDLFTNKLGNKLCWMSQFVYLEIIIL